MEGTNGGRRRGKDGARKSKVIVSWIIIQTFSVQSLCPSAGNIIKITLQELYVLVCRHFVERVAVHTGQRPGAIAIICLFNFVDTLPVHRWVPGRALV